MWLEAERAGQGMVKFNKTFNNFGTTAILPSLFSVDALHHFGPLILNSPIKSQFLTRKSLFAANFVNVNKQKQTKKNS